MRYDVIVVGAGPAGSTAARECAVRGLSVLLLDKAEFPRDKPCGGGVTLRAAKLLPFNLGPVNERTIFATVFTLRQNSPFNLTWPEPLVYLSQRRHLDAYLVEQAVKTGATLRQRAPIKEIGRRNSHFLVRAENESYEGYALVAADGAKGPTAKLAGLKTEHWRPVALEGNITPEGKFPAQWEKAIGLDLGNAPGGYGWLFPKGDHLNIGIGGWPEIGPTLRQRLDGLTRFYGFNPSQLWGLKGHHLPVRRPSSPVMEGNLLLVGDAGGLTDPFTYEGIYAAIWSGQAAARHLAAYLGGEVSDLSGYQREVENDLDPDLKVASQIYHFFHIAPGIGIAILRRSPRLWRLVCRILRGEETYLGFKRRLGPLAIPFDLAAELLVRSTRPPERQAGI